jgi:alkylation response protein AidB-like acyl-CoA dehydrogenase
LDTRAALLSPAVEIELDADQRSFRDLIRDFTDREVRPVAREMEQAGTYPGGIASKMADMGLFGLTVPTEWGGLGADTVTLAVVFEELSRGWMGIAGMIGSHGMACKLIALHGTDDQRRRHLPDLATGARRSGLALTEPDAGSDLQGIRTRAELDGDSYVVTGTKTWITNARHADPLPILVKTDPAAEPPHRGMSILLAAADTPGMEVTKDLGKLGYKGPETCEVVLDQARIPVTELLGGAEGMGMYQAISGLQTGRVNIAARAVGVAHRALEEALEYSTRRQAFGQPIGDFQAASRLDAGGDAVTESAMAKLFASEVALEASLESMRVHGGYGYSTEFEVERLYRDAPLMAIGEGTNDILRTVIAKGLRSEGIPE